MAGLHGLQQSQFIDVDVLSHQQPNAENGAVQLRASLISRRSNTDQKGEHLVKVVYPHKEAILEMRKEESPLQTNTE